MTPTELDETLDAMQLAAAGNPKLMPGLITVESNHWVQVLSDVRRLARGWTIDCGTVIFRFTLGRRR